MKLLIRVLTYPNCNPTRSPRISPNPVIPKMYLSLAPAYRHIVRATSPSTIIDPISGINNKIRNNPPLTAANEIKNSRVLIKERLRKSRPDKKITYPNLKNSTGWSVVPSPIFLKSSHHRAPLVAWVSIPKGVKTKSCKIMTDIPIAITTRSDWSRLRGSL